MGRRRQRRVGGLALLFLTLFGALVIAPLGYRLLPEAIRLPVGMIAIVLFLAIPFWLLYRFRQGGLRDPADSVSWWDRS